MKQSAKLLLLLTLLLSLPGLVNAQGEESVTKSFSVKRGGTLNVRLTSGDIRISTWDKNEVSLKISSDDKEEIDGITAKLEGNKIIISDRNSSSWGWSGDITLNISIPSEFNTEINTQSGDVTQTGSLKGTSTVFTAGGDIRLGDVTGKTTLKSNGGDITTGNVGGELLLSTNGGDVRTGTVNGKVDINTMGGSIDVKNAGNDLSVNTMGGDITVGNINGSADVKTMGGSIRIGKTSGNANINTYGGDISLSGASGNIEATTYGGNLNLKNINGSVNADTKSGNIYIDLNPSGNGNSKIKSLNGNVVLYLPVNAKVNIMATVLARHYNRYTEGELLNLIHSEFGEKNQLLTDGRRGDKIVAKYSINGGGSYNIEIYTVNGHIEIKKK